MVWLELNCRRQVNINYKSRWHNVDRKYGKDAIKTPTECREGKLEERTKH